MIDYTEQNPQFAETIRILEPYDPGTADSVNIATKQLLQNDLYLQKKSEAEKHELSELINLYKQELVGKISELSQNMSQEINKKANSSDLKQIAYTANFNDLLNVPASISYSNAEPGTTNNSVWIG